MNKIIVDTLIGVGGVVYDSIDRFTSIAVSPNNNLLWVGTGNKVLRIRTALGARDSLLQTYSDFHSPHIVADQRVNSPSAWIADEGNNKIKKISSAVTIPEYDMPNGFPRSIALDYTRTPPVLWIADYGNNRVVAVNATTLIEMVAPELHISPGEAELEQPEAITVNTGTF